MLEINARTIRRYDIKSGRKIAFAKQVCSPTRESDCPSPLLTEIRLKYEVSHKERNTCRTIDTMIEGVSKLMSHLEAISTSPNIITDQSTETVMQRSERFEQLSG